MTVTFTGTTSSPSTGITISYDGTAVATTPGTITTDTSGGFSATFKVPSSTEGPHTVTAKDASSNSASAQFTFTTKPVISLDPTSGGEGSSVTVTGTNFSPGSTATISYDSTAVATSTVDTTGIFSATFSVPTSSAGPHTVSATDTVANSATAPFTFTTTSK